MIKITTNFDKEINKFLEEKIKDLSSINRIEAGAKKEEKYKNGTSVNDVMISNEFERKDRSGKIIEPRPALHITLDKNLRKYFFIFIKNTLRNKKALATARELAILIKQDIQKSILSNIQPENAESTIKAWQRYLGKRIKNEKTREKAINEGKKTLIFTGKLLQSIDSEIFMNKK